MSFLKVIFKAIIRMIFGEKKASPVDVAAFFADCSIAMLTSTKAIVVYAEGGTPYYGTACILDVT